MGMVVRTNTMALNAYRQLGMNNSAVAKSLEKLSSGFRINRAGDDAAGLAISEKMKAQITGLETAAANAQDGISLIQTAEGNLTEVHSMLNRMVELASKSANGTYTSQERKALQDEVDALLDEVDRISKSANFNGTKLLNGTMGLNGEALSVGESTAYQAAGTKTIAVDEVHDSADQTEAKPEFVVDFKDFEWTSAAPAADKTATATVVLTFGGPTGAIQVSDAPNATATAWQAITVDGAGAGAAVTVDAAAIVGALDGKNVKIGDYVYTAAADGATGVKFTFAGAADTDPANAGKVSTTDTKVPDNIDALIPKGNLSAAVTAADADGTALNAADGKERYDCPVYDVKDPVAGADPKRTGAKITLDANVIKIGNKLVIGKTEFTFAEGKKPATYTANNGNNATIMVDTSLSEADQMKMVTEQLSHYTAKLTKTVAGVEQEYEFDIGRGAGTDKIEIEEKSIDPDDWGKFTEAELKAAFKYVGSETKANTTLSVLDNDKLAKEEKILVDDKEYKFAKGDDLDATLNNIKNALGSAYDVTTKTVDGKGVVTISAKTATAGAPAIAGSGLTLQIGDTADPFNKMTVKVADMSAKGLGLEELKKVGIMNETSASDAIDIIKNAINTVSTARAGMGALQNRLEHTINNLDVAVENLSAANSRIRDTDMAKEMMNYTKMNVLVQSAQAMLAQANQQPQSVLQLLQ